MDFDDLENRFTYHEVSAIREVDFVRIRDTAKYFAHMLNACVPDGRELSLAITALEEAVFWANAGIAREGKPK